MKTFILLLLLVVASHLGVAQQAPAVVGYPTPVAQQPVSDSLRHAIHKLFKMGRLISIAGGASGGLLVGSTVSYAVRGDTDWSTGLDLFFGANSLALGIHGMVQFSRKRERQVLADLERGKPLPEYVSTWLPMVTR